MLDLPHLPPGSRCTVELFVGSSNAAGQDWRQWTKPRGKSMVHILLVGKGGNGGTGAAAVGVGATGGGGGGSGGQTQICVPLHLLPDTLAISLAGHGTTTTLASYVALGPKLTAGAGAPTANNTLMIANGGGNGADGTNGGLGGAGGSAGAIATAATMPLGWAWQRPIAGVPTALAGQAGTAGGDSAVAGTNLTLPVTGLLVTGGTGGGGAPAAGNAGTQGGNITGLGHFISLRGGAGAGSATVPGEVGAPGYQALPPLGYWWGGTGGGSTFGDGSGSGITAGSGGHGAPGSGGGGGGSTHVSLGNGGPGNGGTGGLGGPAICIITCW